MKREEHNKIEWECGGCRKEERWLLHNVCHRGTYRRLCTNCLLKNHQGLFCPFCLEVYDYEDSLPPPASDRLMCLKCPSITHLSCVPSSYPHSSPSFLCPPCSSPNFSFFRLNKSKAEPETAAADRRAIDRDSAKALVAAAKLAALSMAKAATLARVEAERRAKEAASAKKRARDALEELAFLTANDSHNFTQSLGGVPAVGVVVGDAAAPHHKLLNNSNSKRIHADGVVLAKDPSRNGDAIQGEKKTVSIVNVNAGHLRRLHSSSHLKNK
uniref:Uncharacterized protein n=1 Tax=Rhizophora mucronata TaxID=61149 RepID=A0A2P2NHM7_RHIMU